MSNQGKSTDSEILALQQAMEGLEARVGKLEALVGGAKIDPVAAEDARGSGATTGDHETDGEPTLAEIAERAGANIGAGLIGGILLVLAGAFLLRSLTEGEVLPRVAGVASGLAYSAAWAVICHLLGKRGLRGAASASGLASSLVAFPMIWEATARYQVLSPWIAAGLLVVAGLVLLAIAERHRLAPVSGAAVLGIGSVSLVLMFATRRPEPFAFSSCLLGVVAVWFGPQRGGPLPWFSYLVANLGGLLLVAWSSGERAIAGAIPAVSILSGYCAATLAIIVLQSRRDGKVGAHQVFQGVLVTLLGFGGALIVGDDHLPGIAKALGAVGLTVGICGYAFLLVTFRWAHEHRWAYLFHSSLAVALVAMGSLVLFPQPAWMFAGLAVLLALVGLRLDRASPGLHAAMAILFAAVVGEFGGMVFHGLAAPGSASWPGITPEAATTLAAAILCALLRLKVQSPLWPSWLPRLGRGVVVLVAVLGIDAVLVQLAAPLVAGDPGAYDPGTLAALRTGILAVSVVVLAWGSRYRRLWPAQRLIWPLLGAIAVKLLVEDFPRGRAITMAVALLLCGVALILATRLKRTAKERVVT